MQKRHQHLLSSNHDFLVSEIPMDATLEAMKDKKVLTWHDYEQLKTLRHQGRRALARYFLAVLPHRGPKAFQALLESLQEANAQHLVDLLLQQAGATNLESLLKTPAPGETDDVNDRRTPKTPSDSPLPPGPDPHEYAVKLKRNSRFIRKFVEPADISPVLTQNKVITAREADMVLHLHGKNKKWDLIMAALLQRGERAYQAFMAALLQKEYSTVFHAIQETSTAPSSSDDDDDNDNLSDKSDNAEDDGALESDEDIKAETMNYKKQSNIVDEYLRCTSPSQNFGGADDVLLQRSGDLQEPDNTVSWSSNSFRPKESQLQQVETNGRTSASRAQSSAANGRVSREQDTDLNQRNSRLSSVQHDTESKSRNSFAQDVQSEGLSQKPETDSNSRNDLHRAHDSSNSNRWEDPEDSEAERNNTNHGNHRRTQRRKSSIGLNSVQEEVEY